MVSSSGPVASVSPVPLVRAAVAEETPARRAEPVKPVEPRSFADTPSHQAASRPPANLSIIPAETGQRLIYVFRDPVSGETIRQYPTQSAVALGVQAGNLIDRQV
jgi:hypothetical protein